MRMANAKSASLNRIYFQFCNYDVLQWLTCCLFADGWVQRVKSLDTCQFFWGIMIFLWTFLLQCSQLLIRDLVFILILLLCFFHEIHMLMKWNMHQQNYCCSLACQSIIFIDESNEWKMIFYTYFTTIFQLCKLGLVVKTA